MVHQMDHGVAIVTILLGICITGRIIMALPSPRTSNMATSCGPTVCMTWEKATTPVLTVKDVIESSVRTYEAQKAAALSGPMRFEHTAQDVLDATIEDLSSGRSFLDDTVRAPFVFTIPVANISKAANDIPTHPEIHLKEKILRPYTTEDHEHRAHFCGPIAEGDVSITRHWFQKANMHGFKSPVHECDDIEPYCIMNKFPEYGGDGLYIPNGFIQNSGAGPLLRSVPQPRCRLQSVVSKE